jgi:hypothetical protein
VHHSGVDFLKHGPPPSKMVTPFTKFGAGIRNNGRIDRLMTWQSKQWVNGAQSHMHAHTLDAHTHTLTFKLHQFNNFYDLPSS